jgi:hypothetical protein
VTALTPASILHRARIGAIFTMPLKMAKGVKGKRGRIVVCGEIAPTLLSKGNAEGAIKLEHLWDETTKG